MTDIEALSPPRISVALATYNGERFLREQLESLARQTLLPAELVVADDGSTDGTIAIVERFRAGAPFPVTVLESGSRLNYRLNFRRAAQHCSGELIAFCDQDDVWRDDKLEKMAQVFSDPEVLLAYHNALVLSGGQNRLLHSADEEQRALRERPLSPFKSSNGLLQVFRAELRRFDDLWDLSIDHNEGDVLLAHDQWYYFIASVLGRVRFIDEPLVSYRQHEDNTHGVAVKSGFRHRLTRRLLHFGIVDEWAARSAESRAKIVRSIGEREGLDRLLPIAKRYEALARRRRRRAAIYCEKSASRRAAALVRTLAAGDYRGGKWAYEPASIARDAWSGMIKGKCIDPTRPPRPSELTSQANQHELAVILPRRGRMAGLIESDSVSVAAGKIVAQLIGRRFGAAKEDLPQLDEELAAEVIRVAQANKLLKPVLGELKELGLKIPGDVQRDVRIYLRKAMKNNAAALATLCEVAKKLTGAGIEHAAFKGPVRQIALGQDVFERPVADVDLLVRRSDFGRATDTLKEMGYWIPLFCDSPWWRHYLGEHPLIPNVRNRLGVDLHHRTQHPSCPRPRDQEALLNDIQWIEIGREKVPIFGPIPMFLNTVMSIVKGLANREPTGGHVLDLARQLEASDERRLAEFEAAAREQKLEKSYAVARRAVLVMTGVAPQRAPSWFVPDDALLAMLLTPEDPSIEWPKHTKLLWKLVDGKSRLGRAMKFTREFVWWTAAEFTRRTHDVSQLPARADEPLATAAAS